MLWPDSTSISPSASASAPIATSSRRSGQPVCPPSPTPCTANSSTAGNIWDRSRSGPAISEAEPPRSAARTPGGLLEHAARIFDCSHVEETTLEANPDDLTSPYLGRPPAHRHRPPLDRHPVLRRRLPAPDEPPTQRRTGPSGRPGCRNAGFENITVDLIFGIPGFGGDSLRRTLDRTLELGVEHISAYHLTIEPGTAFGRRAERGTFAPVDEEVSEAEFALVHETLTRAGFEHYEVSISHAPDVAPATTPPTGTARNTSESAPPPTPSTAGNDTGTSHPSNATSTAKPPKPKPSPTATASTNMS